MIKLCLTVETEEETFDLLYKINTVYETEIHHIQKKNHFTYVQNFEPFPRNVSFSALAYKATVSGTRHLWDAQPKDKSKNEYLHEFLRKIVIIFIQGSSPGAQERQKNKIKGSRRKAAAHCCVFISPRKWRVAFPNFPQCGNSQGVHKRLCILYRNILVLCIWRSARMQSIIRYDLWKYLMRFRSILYWKCGSEMWSNHNWIVNNIDRFRNKTWKLDRIVVTN